MIRGLEDMLGVKDGTLSDYRDMIISLGIVIGEKDGRIERIEMKLGH